MTIITGYELSRNWFNYCFENPDVIKPAYTALYFYLIDKWNRYGKKIKFGVPTYHTMEVLGIKSKNTYFTAFNFLIDNDFVKLIEKSKNQNTANIISISAVLKNKSANKSALDLALIQQVNSEVVSVVPIDKQITNNKENTLFDNFWELYDKKVDRKKSENKFNGLSKKVQNKIIKYLPNYISSTPNKKYRKNPTTFLNNESWNNEIEIKKSIKEQYEHHYNNNLEYSEIKKYKDLVTRKKEVLYKFSEIITTDEFKKIGFNGNYKTAVITFLNYGKTKDEFLTNLGLHVRKF